jgi:hypothetical protein
MPENIWTLRGYFFVRTYIAMSMAEKYTLFQIFFFITEVAGQCECADTIRPWCAQSTPVSPLSHINKYTRDVRLHHRVYRVPGFLSSRPKLGPPSPHPQARVALPLLVPGGIHSIGGEGAGDPIRTTIYPLRPSCTPNPSNVNKLFCKLGHAANFGNYQIWYDSFSQE